MNAANSPDITPLQQVPDAFAPLAAKINEVIAALNAMQIPALGEGLHMVEAPQKSATGKPLPSKKLLTIDYAALAKTINPTELNTGGGGGSGAAESTDLFKVQLLAALADPDVYDAIYNIVLDVIAAELNIVSLETCDGTVDVYTP